LDINNKQKYSREYITYVAHYVRLQDRPTSPQQRNHQTATTSMLYILNITKRRISYFNYAQHYATKPCTYIQMHK